MYTIKVGTFHKCIGLILIALIMLVTGCSARSAGMEQQPVAGTLQIDPRLSPDLDKIMDHIHSVSAYKRSIGTQGEKDAAAYLQKELESYGYSPYIQAFPFDLQKRTNSKEFRNLEDDSFWDVDVDEARKDGESQNIIAVKKPDKEADQIIVISAHYDDTGYGAVLDNATGVAVLLEVARSIANSNGIAEVRFVLFGGEQNDLNGSRNYVSGLSEEENILADINLDYLGIKGTNDLILATLDGNENQASSLFKNFLESQELQIVQAPPSDYVSFARAGIPAVSLGQLPMPIKTEGEYTTMEDQTNKLIQAENSLLDEGRLKTAFNMVISALSQAAK